MLSRTANSIYWMARYLERAENVARFIAVNVHLMLDMGITAGHAQWKPLVTASGDDADFAARYDAPSEKNVLEFLTFDEMNPNSIVSCIYKARENARTVRDVISTEMWEQINALYHMVQKHSTARKVDNLEPFYQRIRSASHHFTGLTEDTMSHGEGWHFACMGRMLERAEKTSRMLDVKYFLLLPDAKYVDTPYDAVEWGAVLKSANGFEMYRKHYHHINYHDVADFLLFNPTFPRSVAYCISTAARSLHAIANELQIRAPAQAEMATLQKMLAANSVERVLAEGLHEFIDIFQFNLNVVDQSIYQSFFAGYR